MTVTLAQLRTIDLFDDTTDEDLALWVAVARPVDVEPGDVIAQQAEEPVGVYMLLTGEVQTVRLDGDRVEPIGRQIAPTWMGAIAVLTGGPVGARMQAATPCHLALIPREDFHRLALSQPAVHRRVMRAVGPVMARITGMEQSRERLTSLGTMAAGLAHELNNPAAAARRAAAQLADVLDDVVSSIGLFVDAGLEREQAAELVIVQREALRRAEQQSKLEALDAADAEDDLRDQLEDMGVADAWRLAEPLAAAGIDGTCLARVQELSGAATAPVLAWIAGSLSAHTLAAELQESTDRMSQLVSAVKTYAYMDRGEIVEADLHDGLETTVVVLGHKLKHTSITVVREYDRELPRVMVHGSELNQVWTNLLDNAIDALGERGTITIRTRREGDCAVVEISDDGPGIAPADREHIFDSFFTTKDVGQGTGLGLATARRIVVDRHDGSLTVDSRPGETTFRVWIPLTARTAEEAP
jgi:signal transduction histidine kinase